MALFAEQLTANFTLPEFLKSPGAQAYFNNAPMAEKQRIYDNISLLAQRLQILRDELGCPFVITSGLRTPARNAELPRAAKESTHLTGLGADFVVPGRFIVPLQKLCENWTGGYHYYPEDGHFHLDVRGYRARW